MDDIGIFKAAYHMHDGIHFTDVCQKLVAQTFALGCAFHQTCDVHKLDRRMRHLFGVIHLSEFFDTLIRHRNNADIRIDRAERKVCRLRPRLGQ